MTCSRLMLLLALTLVLSLSIVRGGAAGGADEKAVVATVNDTSITAAQLESAVDLAIARYRKSGFRIVSEDFRQRIRRQELDKLIDMELLVQAGAANAGKEVDELIARRLEALKSANHQVKGAVLAGPAAYEAARRDVLVDEYLRQTGIASLQVPEEELKKFYAENLDNFKEPESVKVRHILLELAGDASPEEIAKTQKEAEELRAKVIGGADFAELARQYSHCASARNGGDLGYIKKGFMPAAFDTAVAALKPGEIGIARTAYGVHLLQVVERRPPTVKPFEQVKAFIAQYLQKDYQRRKIEERVEELKRKARIIVDLN